MICAKVRCKLPGYFDGTLVHKERAMVREHVELCSECRDELESYRKLGMLLSRVEPVAPPADLSTRIRVQISQQSRRAGQGWAERLRSRASLTFDNILKPLAVPATGGLVTALLVFALVAHNLLPGLPVGAVPNDLPIRLIQPARLESLAPFPVPGLGEGRGQDSGADTVVLEATVNAQGEVVDYRILSGTGSPAVRRQLEQILLFSRFRPLMNFGRPTAGGRVVLSFSQIEVRG